MKLYPSKAYISEEGELTSKMLVPPVLKSNQSPIQLYKLNVCKLQSSSIAIKTFKTHKSVILKNAEMIILNSKVANFNELAIGILHLQLDIYNTYVFILKVVYTY